MVLKPMSKTVLNPFLKTKSYFGDFFRLWPSNFLGQNKNFSRKQFHRHPIPYSHMTIGTMEMYLYYYFSFILYWVILILPTSILILWSCSLIDKTWVSIILTTSAVRQGLFFDTKYSFESLIACSTIFGNNGELYLKLKNINNDYITISFKINTYLLESLSLRINKIWLFKIFLNSTSLEIVLLIDDNVTINADADSIKILSILFVVKYRSLSNDKA